MTRTPNPFLVVALLVSIFVHLFLLDRAIELTLKLQLFSTSTADELFRVRDVSVRRTEEIEMGRPQWRPQDIISLGAPREVTVEQETKDTETLLESEKFISSDVTEEKLLGIIEKAIEAEKITKADEAAPGPSAESVIAQEILAVDAATIKDRIPASRPRISMDVPRGTATEDFIFFTDRGPSVEPEPTGIRGYKTGEGVRPGSATEKKDMARLAMVPEAGTIPGVIAPPPPIAQKQQEIETAELGDIVTVDYEKIRKYPPLDELLTVQLFTYHRPREEKGYFKLVVEPRRDRTDFSIIPKDIVFVVDSSKSITQKKLDSYVAGLKLCVKSLPRQDRFNIVEFKDFTHRLSEEDVIPVTSETLARGEEFLSGLVSVGSTDVYGSLTELVAQKPQAGRPRIIFLVSDGRPTTGIRKDSEIINEVTRLNDLRISIFTFAGGEMINTSLLDLLSYRNRGGRHFESDDKKIAQSLFEFYEEFSFPILLNPRFNFGSVDSTDVYPKILPDLYLKGRLEMFGRFAGEDEFSMQLLGEADGRTKEYVLQQKLTGRDSGDESVARTWAFRKIYYLIGQMVQKGGSQKILSEIEKLGADYNVETSYHLGKGGGS